MSANIPKVPQGAMPAIGVPDSQDFPRLVYCAPYFTQVPLAELIEPSVTEAVEAILPALVPPYVDVAAANAVSQLAVLLTGSTMSGPLFLNPLMPTQDSQATSKAYVDAMLATAGIPDVPPVPSGQVWARMTGQWTPIDSGGGAFLPLGGGTMQGNIDMSGNTINNLAAVPGLPNGAAPAQWVLNQIASVSLYQGTWNADTNVPDLTQLSVRVNGYTWIAITTSVDGVVVSEPIPGLQGMTIFNGDTIIYSTVQGAFTSIHAGGLSLPEAQALFLQLAGGQMSGPLLLNTNATQPMQAVTLQQLQAFVPPGAVGEAPDTGAIYGRNGLTQSWAPVLPLSGGTLSGALTLAGNAVASLNAVPLQQLTSSLAAYVPLAGNVTVTGPLTMGNATATLTLAGNAASNLQPVPLQQLTATLANYVTQTQLNNAPYISENYVDNSGFTVNQRDYLSGAILSSLQYGFDRWRAVAGGSATLTFTDTPGSTIVSITSGTLVQVIEGINFVNGPYTLSWSGTATCEYFSSGSNNVGGASPLQNNLVAGQNATISFSGGTLGQVKLQMGTVATPWQPIPAEVELARCMRFYQQIPVFLGGMFFEGGNLPLNYEPFAVWFRASPTAAWIPGSPTYGGVVSLANFSVVQPTMFIPQVAVTGAGSYVVNGAAGFSADL